MTAPGPERQSRSLRLVPVMQGAMLALILVYGVVFWRNISDLKPQAASYPRALIIVLLVLVAAEGLRLTVAMARSRADEDELESTADLWPKTVLTAVLTLAYVWGFTETGILVASVLFVAALSVVLRSTVKEIVLMTVLVPAVTVLVFKYALQLRLDLI